LIEVYAPVLRDRDGQLIAVNEFYLLPDQLEAQIADARLRAWLIVGALGALLYALSQGIVQRGSTTIERQRKRLQLQVHELATMHARMLHAANRTTALNEQSLRRISADLHDGPAQVLALAMLRLDALQTSCGDFADFAVVHDAIRDALAEVRAISSGLRLPELEAVPVADVLERAVSEHERRCGMRVVRQTAQLPRRAPLAVKIALVRTLQEALSNATRHAPEATVTVRAWGQGNRLFLEVADCGPGFEVAQAADVAAGHLGLAGMRERTELLSGTFTVRSAPGAGTTIRACWPLAQVTS
jgi:signal transduction histidine kinase